MRRALATALAALLCSCGVLLWPPPVRGVQNTLPPGGLILSNSLEVELESLETAITVGSTGEQFFLLVNLLAANGGTEVCTLTMRLHNVSGAVADQTMTVPLPGGGANLTAQLPYNTNGTVLGLGPETFQVFARRNCNVPVVLAQESYFGIFGSTIPGGVLISFNGDLSSVQTLQLQAGAIGTCDGTAPCIYDDLAGVHTLVLPNADTTKRGVVTTGAQSFNGFKTFIAGGAGTDSGTGSCRWGQNARAQGANATAYGTSSFASGAGGVAVGSFASAQGADSIAQGRLADDNGFAGAVVTGAGADANGVNGTCQGTGCQVAANATCLGDHCVVSTAGGACFGAGCSSVAGEFVLGSESYPLSTVYAGKGKASASPSAITYRGTNSFGTNVNGGPIALQGGAGTGSAHGGAIAFRYCVPGSSGTSQNSCAGYGDFTDRFRVFTNVPHVFGDGDNAKIVYDGTDLVIDPDLVGAGSARINGTLNLAERLTVEEAFLTLNGASDDISPIDDVNTIQLQPQADMTLSSTPTIPDGVEGQHLRLLNTDATFCVTLQDAGTLANSNLELEAPRRRLCPRGVLNLFWDTTWDRWLEEGYTDNAGTAACHIDDATGDFVCPYVRLVNGVSAQPILVWNNGDVLTEAIAFGLTAQSAITVNGTQILGMVGGFGAVSVASDLDSILFFAHLNTYTNSGVRDFGKGDIFIDQPTFNINASSPGNAIGAYSSFFSGPKYRRTSGANTIEIEHVRGAGYQPDIGAGFHVEYVGGSDFDPSKIVAGTADLIFGYRVFRLGDTTGAQRPTEPTVGFSNQDATAHPAAAQTVSADSYTVVAAHATLIELTAAAPRTFSSTPTVALALIANQEIELFNAGANTLTFSDDGTVSGSKLHLGATTRALASGGTLKLRYHATPAAGWYETGFTNVQ